MRKTLFTKKSSKIFRIAFIIRYYEDLMKFSYKFDESSVSFSLKPDFRYMKFLYNQL